MKDNVMRTIRIEKVVLSVGGVGDDLAKGVKLLELLTQRKPAKMKSKKGIPTWNVRPGLEIGAVVTIRKDIELIDLRTINPLDHDTIHESVQKTGRLVVVHEAYKTCGVGAEIVSQATEACLKYMIIPPLRIGAKDTPIPASSVLEDHNVPSSVSIEKSILDHLGKFL